MSIYNLAAWNVVLGLSLMFIGGLVLWAYGARHTATTPLTEGPEVDSAKLFHSRLTRWFFTYGVTIIAIGAALLLRASANFF